MSHFETAPFLFTSNSVVINCVIIDPKEGLFSFYCPNGKKRL